MTDLTRDALTMNPETPAHAAAQQSAANRHVQRTAAEQGWPAGDLADVLAMIDRGQA